MTIEWPMSDSHMLMQVFNLAAWYDITMYIYVTKDFILVVVKRTTKINSLPNWWDGMVLPYTQESLED